jgi:hypothetical protein
LYGEENEHEITCVVQDEHGSVTHVCFGERTPHSTFIIARLIIEGKNSFYALRKGNKIRVGVRISENGLNSFLPRNSTGLMDFDDLGFLPKCKCPK